MKTNRKKYGFNPLVIVSAAGTKEPLKARAPHFGPFRKSAGRAESIFKKKLDTAVTAIENDYLASAALSIEDISEKVLKEAKRLTDSSYGFAGYIDPATGWFVAVTLTRDIWDKCRIPDKSAVFKEFTGLWGWVLKNKKPLLTNNAPADRRSSGAPKGHIKIENFLAAPAVFNRKLAGMLALANPSRNYTERDLAAAKKLARVYAIIIQRKFAEDRLKESEEKYRTLFENANAAIFLADAGTGTILDANNRAERLTGRGRGELIGMNRLLLHPPEEAEYYKDHFKDPLDRGRVNFSEAVVARKDGTQVPVQISAAVMEIGGKKVIQGIFEDVTGRRRAVEALRESERKIRALFDQTFQFIGMMTPDGTLIEANRTAMQFAGINESDCLGKPFWDTPWWTHSAEMQNKLREAAAKAVKGETVRFEATHIAADGSMHYIDFSLKPIKDVTGETIFLIPEGRDITELKRMEAELAHAKAVEAVGKIAGPIAHDFNNILAAINGYSTLILETLNDKSPAKPEIMQIIKAVGRAAAVTEKLQTFSRKPDTGGMRDEGCPPNSPAGPPAVWRKG
ncbi:MAG: PAS domain S-box protein [Elusimicrobia bacterium]|nr:PAS domain S-box protein [Elusimicrobiota bacterium]